MGCCDKTKVSKKSGRLLRNEFIFSEPPYQYCDARVRICHRCHYQIWSRRRLFCQAKMRRAGKVLWADPLAFVPAMAKVPVSLCALHKWPQ
jgi:hypothetical protein